MPTFQGYGPLSVQGGPGDRFTLFAPSDTLVAGSQSRVIAIAHAAPFGVKAQTFQLSFATTPTAVVEIFGSNIPPTVAGPDPNGVLLYTSTNKITDNYTDNLAFEFYWAQLISQSAGGALTLTDSIG